MNDISLYVGYDHILLKKTLQMTSDDIMFLILKRNKTVPDFKKILISKNDF